jgi:hypothetical protein
LTPVGAGRLKELWMMKSSGRRIGAIVGCTTLAVAMFGAIAGSASAATTNPCKVLKQQEIVGAFGGTVSSGKKGLTTPVSTQCEYKVSADGDRPDGTVIVHLMTTGAKAAYTGLKKTSLYVPIDGVPNSLWADKTHVVDILKGNVLVGVQGNFLITDPLPIHFYDAKTQLTDLAQTAAKRV